MKHSPLKLIQPGIYFFAFVVIIFITGSCTNSPTKDVVVLDDSLKTKTVITPLVTDCKNVFLSMRTSVPDFLNIKGKMGFKRIICQFKNNGFAVDEGGFVYGVVPYALKNNDYFDSTFMQIATGKTQLSPPYRFANIELRKGDVKDFIDSLNANHTPIESFDSIIFRPFIDNSYGSNIVNLRVIPFKTGIFADSAAVTATTTKFNPCPPARQQ
jgi:hypothetical protein